MLHFKLNVKEKWMFLFVFENKKDLKDIIKKMSFIRLSTYMLVSFIKVILKHLILKSKFVVINSIT